MFLGKFNEHLKALYEYVSKHHSLSYNSVLYTPLICQQQLPENNPSVMRESKQKTQEWMDALKAAADDPNPIYKSFGAKKN